MTFYDTAYLATHRSWSYLTEVSSFRGEHYTLILLALV